MEASPYKEKLHPPPPTPLKKKKTQTKMEASS